MRIGVDAKRALNNFTGLGNHARILFNAMMRDFPGNEYLFFTPKSQDSLLHQLNGSFRIFPPQSTFQKHFHSLWRSFGITVQLKKESVDIYHGISNELPFNIHSSGIKSVVTIHDLIFLKHTAQYPFIDRQIYTLKTRYAAKNADKIIAASFETKNDLIQYYRVPENRIEVIYPAVDPAFQRNAIFSKTPGVQSEDLKHETDVRQKYKLPSKYILNVGSFLPRKNQRTIIEAFDKIKDQVEENLVLAGSAGNTKQELVGLIKQRKLEDRVKIISDISNSDLPAVYKMSNLFVFPSLYEGFGAPILEALFSGTPVITTKGGAMEETGGKHSYYVTPLNVDELGAAILQVLGDEILRKEMIEKGYEHAITMSDRVFASKTMSLYREVLNA